MAQYGWATCPSEVRAQIDLLQERLQALLGANLVGLYLHGSLALGCFNPQSSDIDLLVVTVQSMSVEIKRDVVELLLHSSRMPYPIEISFLVERDMHPFRHPLPYDLHYSEDWRERYQADLASGVWTAWNNETRRDADLAVNITVTRARGIILFGRPIKEVFPPVPTQDCAASILSDFAWARERRATDPGYFVLNACRACAYLRDGVVLSKDEGGEWGLRELPQEYHALITQALERYRGVARHQISEAALDNFAAYTSREIQAFS
jgi:predicted nucleotidyltransferase